MTCYSQKARNENAVYAAKETTVTQQCITAAVNVHFAQMQVYIHGSSSSDSCVSNCTIAQAIMYYNYAFVQLHMWVY